jgi:methyltransferase family protein
VLAASRQRLITMLSEEAVVLDVGGWADPFARADWVIDVMPYATRGLYEREGWIEPRNEPERFRSDTWIERDVCDRASFPFADQAVDFAICSHTLEDLRDPVWVCSELVRVAKAGYIEVPSRLEEQSWGVNGDFVGWSHHRWLIDVLEDRIEFVVKLHSLHARPDQYFPPGFWEGLSESERVQTLWWTGAFSFAERVIVDAGESERYLNEFVAGQLARRGLGPASGSDAPRAKLRRISTRLRRHRSEGG